MQPILGPGHSDVEQPPLLLQSRGGVGVDDRHRALVHADQEDDRPLKTLGGMERGQGDPCRNGCVLGVGPPRELSHETGEIEPGMRRLQLAGEVDHGLQRLPPVSHAAAPGGCLT